MIGLSFPFFEKNNQVGCRGTSLRDEIAYLMQHIPSRPDQIQALSILLQIKMCELKSLVDQLSEQQPPKPVD